MNKHLNGAFRLSAAIAALLMTWQASASEQQKALSLGILSGQKATQKIGEQQCVTPFPNK